MRKLDMNKWISLVETPTFTKMIESIATSETKESLCEFLAKHPTAGDIIKGTGGCRKLRWQRNAQSGKSVGLRTIYYYHDEGMPIYLLIAYAKNVQDNLTAETKQQLKKTVKGLVESNKKGSAYENHRYQ